MVNTMQLQMINCPACNQDKLPVKRKELGYHVCVDCSTAKPVVGITTVEGSGDPQATGEAIANKLADSFKTQLFNANRQSNFAMEY